ncbi:MAG: hypothetical protein Q4F75_05225 [Pseudomonadota bacterium]|nr:hypothetical protein [Pseudomonadota bacterium]
MPMKKKCPLKTDYLNLSALLEAEKNGRFSEQLALKRANVESSGLTTESYALEFARMERNRKSLSPAVKDTLR